VNQDHIAIRGFYQGFGASFSNSLGKITHNGGVGVEEIVTGHTGFPGHTSRDDDNVHALQSFLKTDNLKGINKLQIYNGNNVSLP
jgi:hypothetical protein